MKSKSGDVLSSMKAIDSTMHLASCHLSLPLFRPPLLTATSKKRKRLRFGGFCSLRQKRRRATRPAICGLNFFASSHAARRSACCSWLPFTGPPLGACAATASSS